MSQLSYTLRLHIDASSNLIDTDDPDDFVNTLTVLHARLHKVGDKTINPTDFRIVGWKSTPELIKTNLHTTFSDRLSGDDIVSFELDIPGFASVSDAENEESIILARPPNDGVDIFRSSIVKITRTRRDDDDSDSDSDDDGDDDDSLTINGFTIILFIVLVLLIIAMFLFLYLALVGGK